MSWAAEKPKPVGGKYHLLGLGHEHAAVEPFGSQFKNNHFTEMYSGSEAGSYLRLIDSCITQLKAQGPSRTCNEDKEEEEEEEAFCTPGLKSGPGFDHFQANGI